MSFNYIIYVMATVFSLSYSDVPYVIPKGWREPTIAEMHDPWRAKSNTCYMAASGDYNGDGIEDTAKLLFSLDGHKIGLFIFLSQNKQPVQKEYLIDIIDDVNVLQDIGIKTINAGIYETACGKGYWDCKNGETPEINLKNPGIDYFKYESANSFVYWDHMKNKFLQIWISD